MSTKQLLRTALNCLLANKLRLVLTTLGVIIGVASVIAMLSLGNGARAAVEASFRFLGSNQVKISSRTRIEDGVEVAYGEILSYQDGLLMPAEVALVDRVEMSIRGSGRVRHGRANVDLIIQGVTANALESVVYRQALQPAGQLPDESFSATDLVGQGRFFSTEEVRAGADVCVLGQATALALFYGDNALDQVVRFNRRRCVVIGVLSELETVDPDRRRRAKVNDTFYLPISTAIHHLYEQEPPVEMTAHVANEDQMAEAKTAIAAFLRARHHIEREPAGDYADDFELTTRQDVLGAQLDSARTFSTLLAAMAAVSLVVGGIGIMNVMLVSVTERTREIGIRQAIGASRQDIVAQFLWEAILLSAGGGVLGILAGILFVPAAASFNQGIALLSAGSIPLSFGVALLVGLVFGLYPAVRASRLDPIEALRHQ